MMYLQMAVVLMCGIVLVVGVSLRSKGVNLATVVDQVQETLNPANTLLTAAEHKAKAKDRENRRRIGWSRRRLISYFQLCHYKTRVKAMNHLNRMAYSTNSVNAKMALEVLEQLALGQGDQKFSARAMEVLKAISPKRALKAQIANNTKTIPVISEFLQNQTQNARIEQVSEGMPQAA